MSIITGQGTPPAGQGTPPAGDNAPGNQTPDWRSALPDDLRAEKVFESIKGKDWSEAGPLLAKNYLHAQRMVGADKIVLPTDKSTPEEIAAFRAKLGVPAKPDEYSFKLPEGMKDTMLDKTRIDTWRKELHEAGIPKSAAERLMSKFIGDEYARFTESQTNRTKQEEQWGLQLKQDFGVKYDEEVNNARFAVRQFGNDALGQLLDETGLGSHPEVVKLFAKIGKSIGDDRIRGGNQQQAGSINSPEQAQAALNEWSRSAENMKALMDRNHPNHDRAVAERRQLFETAFPKPS